MTVYTWRGTGGFPPRAGPPIWMDDPEGFEEAVRTALEEVADGAGATH